MNLWTMGAVGLGSLAASARWNWWRPGAQGLPILMYHKIGPAPKGSPMKKLWVSTDKFRWQMEYLKRKGYSTLTFADLEAARQGHKELPQKPVMVSFDDGYQNNYTDAYPVLKELGLKANVFLVSEALDRHNYWHDPASEGWIKMLTWAQIREMSDSRVFEFANHTMSHANLLRVPLEDARWQIAEAKKRLEDKMGRAMPAFAYPYGAGAYEPKVREAVYEAGHTLDFGIRQGLARWPMAEGGEPLQRLFIRGEDNRFDFYLQLTRGKSRL